MARFCIDSNIIIASVKIIDNRISRGEMSKSDIKFGKDNTLYKLIRKMIKGLNGELVTTKSIFDEMERNLNIKSGHKHRLKKIYGETYYPLVKDLLSNKLRLFNLSSSEYQEIKDKRYDLENFELPEEYKRKYHTEKKNIYTDYILAKECSENDITAIVSRNEIDFQFCKMFDPSLEIPRIYRPSDSFFKEANEELKDKYFSTTISGNLLRMINEIYTIDGLEG